MRIANTSALEPTGSVTGGGVVCPRSNLSTLPEVSSVEALGWLCTYLGLAGVDLPDMSKPVDINSSIT